MLPLEEDVVGQVLLRVLVRDDLRAGLSEQLVRTGVLRVPVGVEQKADRLTGGEFGNSRGQVRRVLPKTAVYHRNAVIAGDDNDVATRTGNECERLTQTSGRERRVMALRVRATDRTERK